MAEVIEAANEIVEVDRDRLLETAILMKHQGRRLVQAQTTWYKKSEAYECLYTFTDDDTYDTTTYKVILTKDQSVPSITSIYPYANFYESEMTELYGVKIEMIDGDYHDKLYRIKAVHPFGPEEGEK